MSADARTAQATRETVQRFYQAIGAWDEAGLRAVIHPDAQLHQPQTLPYGGIYRGPDEMMKLWKNIIMRLADPASFLMEEFLVEGHTAVVITSSLGATTGKPMLVAEEYLVRDDQLERIRIFWHDVRPVVEEANALVETS